MSEGESASVPARQEPDDRDEEQAPRTAGGADRFGRIAIRGAAAGAAVGAVAGAALAVAKAMRPDEADAARRAIADAAREVGTEAVRAAGAALTARPVSDLLNAGKGNGDTAQAVKQAAKEAGVAAAGAAGDAIASMREGRRAGEKS